MERTGRKRRATSTVCGGPPFTKTLERNITLRTNNLEET